MRFITKEGVDSGSPTSEFNIRCLNSLLTLFRAPLSVLIPISYLLYDRHSSHTTTPILFWILMQTCFFLLFQLLAMGVLWRCLQVPWYELKTQRWWFPAMLVNMMDPGSKTLIGSFLQILLRTLDLYMLWALGILCSHLRNIKIEFSVRRLNWGETATMLWNLWLETFALVMKGCIDALRPAQMLSFGEITML